MIIWLDAQLPPLLANWINGQSWNIKAIAVRDLALRDARDSKIFQAAREAGVVVMTKDRDFMRLLATYGPPPKVIWVRLGNCSNAALQDVLARTLKPAVEHLQAGEPWVEIRPNPFKMS